MKVDVGSNKIRVNRVDSVLKKAHEARELHMQYYKVINLNENLKEAKLLVK